MSARSPSASGSSGMSAASTRQSRIASAHSSRRTVAASLHAGAERSTRVCDSESSSSVRSIPARVGDFAKGVIDTGNVVFFLAATAWFLVLTYVAVGSRRWR